MKKKIVLPAFLAIAILAIGILATGVSAEESYSYPAVVQRLANRFNLNVRDVRRVFDEERDERRAEAFARFADRLDDLISEGKITEEQKDAILDKHEDMHNTMEELDGLSPDERHEEMQKIHEEYRNWLEEQGFEENFLGMFRMRYGRDGSFRNGYGEGLMMGSGR